MSAWRLPQVPPMKVYTFPEWRGAVPDVQWRGDQRTLPSWPDGYFEMRYSGSNMEVRPASSTNGEWLRVQDLESLRETLTVAAASGEQETRPHPTARRRIRRVWSARRREA